jgi:hypothetical protein
VNQVKWILAAVAVLVAQSAAAASFTFINKDDPGEGLNDPAAFTPVGGNTATTLGAARLAVLQEAGRIWGLQLTSTVNIVVEAKFDSLTCTASSGTLGSAGPLYVFADFPGAPLPNVYYPAALADALAGTNGNQRNDIAATFNSDVNGNDECLGGANFYLGFNHAPALGDADLLNVVLHEFGHGLGFAGGIKEDGTSLLGAGNFTIFAQSVYSESLGRFWPAMTDAERQASLISDTDLVWNGAAVNGETSRLTNGLSSGGHLKLYAPNPYTSSSSGSHWDISAQWNPTGVALRSLLMEPFNTANPLGLTDFTGCVLRDLGWQGTRCVDQTGAASDPTAFPQTVAATEDTPKQITILGTDPDTAALTYAIIAPPTRGSLSAPASLVSSTGVIYTYTPTANLSGADAFVFQVSDGTHMPGTATVTINVAEVNDKPIANDQTFTATAGTARIITLTGSDVDGTALGFTIVTNPAKGTLSGTAPNLTYTASKGSSGIDTFTFRVNDGVFNSSNATVTINVTAPAGGGGGGGSLDWLGLLLLTLLVLRTRWRTLPVSRSAGKSRGP